MLFDEWFVSQWFVSSSSFSSSYYYCYLVVVSV